MKIRNIVIVMILSQSILLPKSLLWDMGVYLKNAPYAESSFMYQIVYCLYTAGAIESIASSEFYKKEGVEGAELTIQGKVNEARFLEYSKENLPLSDAREAEPGVVVLEDTAGKGTVSMYIYKDNLGMNYSR